MAHAVFDHLVAALPPSQHQIRTDSAGTGAYHELDPPDPRTMATLVKHGITDYDHAARKVQKTDFEEYDYIFAMDRYNLSDLRQKCRRLKKSKELENRISLFGDWDFKKKTDNRDRGEEVQDPYYGADDGFEQAFQQCVRFSKGWLRDILGVDVDIDDKGEVCIINSDPPKQED